MATLTFSPDDQIWVKCGKSETQNTVWNFAVSGIPSGATINAVTLTFTVGNYYATPYYVAVYTGSTVTSSANIWNRSGSYVSGSSHSVSLSSYIKGNGNYTLTFYANNTSTSSVCNVYFTDVTVTVNYTIPYTACGAPTSVKVALTITHNATTLSWSGAKAGTSNAITAFEVQRCESSNGSSWGSWSALSTVSSSAASGSLSVSPPGTYGNYYKYRVRTQGAAGSSYYSEWAESSNTLRRDHAPLADFTDPTLTKNESFIRALHMTELQDRVNTLRAFYGLAEYVFSTIIAGETDLKGWSAHVEEIRTAVDDIGKTHDAWITITENRPSVAVIEQLREVVLAI